MENNYTVQDIFQKFGTDYINQYNLSDEQWKVVNAIRKCKTKELGIHTITCSECGEVTIGYNSCRNRHCPMCQSYAREKWIDNESKYLLDCAYFHIITTVPAELNEIAMYNQKDFYNILLKATSESILELTNDPKWLGAKVGITSILHTWGQTMEFHPHVHNIVTGGGISNNEWLETKENYIFKVQVLSSLFKQKFLSMLKNITLNLPEDMKKLKDPKELNNFLRSLYNKDWVTYIEPPKGNPQNVIEYIGRYAFRVAISNYRIKNIDEKNVTFEYKDYKDNSKIKLMTITGVEFIRRFLLHVLPNYFTKIKHYGILANRNKKAMINLCRILIGQKIFSNFVAKKEKSRTLIEFKCEKCGCNKFNYSFFYKRLNAT